MAKLITALAVFLGLFVLLRVGVTFASRTPATGGIQTSSGSEQLGDCLKKPNCQGSQSSRANQRVDALAITSDANKALPTATAAIIELGGKVVLQQQNYLHATFKTPVMGYTDDVELLLDTDKNELHIRSASRLGKSDLGANKKRIDRIRQQLTGKL